MEFQRLREAYDNAFERLSAAVRSGIGISEAQAEYRERRDALCRYIINSDRVRRTSAIQRVAYALWESEGRRHGSDQSYWFRAEDLIKRHARDVAQPGA